MYKMLIGQYIQGITPNDLKHHLEENGFESTEEEREIMYGYLKSRWEEIYDGKEKVFQELKEKLNPNLYQKLFNLYKDTKQKYHF